jgi:hypothetical protein
MTKKEVMGVIELMDEGACFRIPDSRLFGIELVDEEDELDFNEILRLADEDAVPPEPN